MARAINRLVAKKMSALTGPKKYPDGGGLTLVVDKNGSKRWVFRYRHAGRRRDMGLGSYPTVSLQEARARANAARGVRSGGDDPVTSRRAERARVRIPTFEDVAREVIKSKHGDTENEKVRYQWTYLLGATYCSPLLKRPINEITTSDIKNVLDPVAKVKPTTAGKILVRLRAVFANAAVSLREKHGIKFDNPTRWEDLKALGYNPSKQLIRGHQPAIPYADLPHFMKKLMGLQRPSAQALVVLILSALRTEAILLATWDEINFSEALWVVPIKHLKDKRTRKVALKVPLNDGLLAVLHRLHAQRVSKYIFPGQKVGKPLSNMAMAGFLKSFNSDDEGKPIWLDAVSKRPIVPHGFRATFRSWAADKTNYSFDICEAALGHGVPGQTAAAYQRGELLEKRRALMADWEALCLT